MKGDKYFQLAEKIRFENYQNWDTYNTKQQMQRVEKRLDYLRKAAYVGHPQAQFDLACFYQYGVYVNGNFYFYNEDKMLYWMKKAAHALYPDAAENMALLYESNPQIQDLQKAKEYYALFDEITGQKMSKNRKLFLKQLDNGLFMQDPNGYYKLVKDWKKRLK